jgi:hypothetical protein
MRAQSAIGGVWLLMAFCASLLFVLAIVLGWVNLRPGGYQLAGSSDPTMQTPQAKPAYPPRQIRSDR